MTNRFDVQDFKRELEDLERELEDAHRFIRYLIDRFGQTDPTNTTRRIIFVDPLDLEDAPRVLFRWDEVCRIGFGVKRDEQR